MNSGFKDLLRIFANTELKYLIVDGYAVSEYTEPRYTKGLDIWIDNSIENAKLTMSALRQ